MQSIYKLKTVDATVSIPTIEPRVVHPADIWDIIGSVRNVSGDFILDDEVVRAIREVIMPHGTPETYHVLVWAALQSKECFENIVSTPGLAEHYYEQATAEIDHESISRIFE